MTVRFAPEDEGAAEAALLITRGAGNEASPLTLPAVGDGRIQLAALPERP